MVLLGNLKVQKVFVQKMKIVSVFAPIQEFNLQMFKKWIIII